MPSTSAGTVTKRKYSTFSPPRPKTTKTNNGKGVTKTSASESKRSVLQSRQRKSNRLTSPTPSDPESTADSDIGSASASLSPHSEPDYILAEVTHAEVPEDNEAIISLALIHTLLNHHFSDKDKTRISQEAKAVIGKYVDTFVREAIARSAFERKEKGAEDTAGELDGRGDDGWLEVEDLEKMAPQLVLDF